MNMWDERYREHQTVYGTAPNQFLASQLALRAPGSIALPCDGEGRNAVAAARWGWEVWSFDASAVGVDKSLMLAQQQGVAVEAVVADAFVIDPGRQFDCVALVFAHMPAQRRAEFHRRAWSWVKPGGVLVAEGFHVDQLGLTSGGPKQRDMLFEPSTLPADVLDSPADGRVVWRSVCHQILDEGPFHQGPAVTCQWVIEKAE